jgi:cytoskeletal protein CcmA (bactofilin family)
MLVTIGKSMQIKGEVSGNEDLIIDGKVDGKISLKGHKLTIGASGHITAEIQDAKAVVVGGEMLGSITAEDKVEIAATGSMQGDIKAPRVVLADGARFKGSIDMEPKSAAHRASASPSIGNAVAMDRGSGTASSSDLSRRASRTPRSDRP